MIVEYSSNNSGGSWWLSDEDWLALEKAGWNVEWVKDQVHYKDMVRDGRWLGALATSATREGLNLGSAISEWEYITGETSNDLGCSCCGSPHSFSFTGDDGTSEYYYPESPTQGDRY